MLNDEVVLTFEAILISQENGDQDRRFAFLYSITTDTVSIFEGKNPSLGIKGGKFLQKTKINNPLTGSPYTSKDFYVGATIGCVGRIFKLTGASEFSLCTMEAHPNLFPFSDLNQCVSNLSSVVKAKNIDLSSSFKRFDNQQTGQVSKANSDIVFSAVQPEFTEQEIITIQRRFLDNDQFDYGLLLRYL